MRADENRCSNRRRTAWRSSASTCGSILTASFHRINEGARDALVDDFRNGTMAESKDGCAAGHRLDHYQAERLRPIDREQKGLRLAQELVLLRSLISPMNSTPGSLSSGAISSRK
jgi:hypothetical protein